MLVFRFQISFFPALVEYVALYQNRVVTSSATAAAAAANCPRLTSARAFTIEASCRTRMLSLPARFARAESAVATASANIESSETGSPYENVPSGLGKLHGMPLQEYSPARLATK